MGWVPNLIILGMLALKYRGERSGQENRKVGENSYMEGQNERTGMGH